MQDAYWLLIPLLDAIVSLKERKGSSRPAIKKYILANYKVTAGSHFDSQIAAAIKRGHSKNVFSLPKGKFIILFYWGTFGIMKDKRLNANSTFSFRSFWYR